MTFQKPIHAMPCDMMVMISYFDFFVNEEVGVFHEGRFEVRVCTESLELHCRLVVGIVRND